MLSKVRLLIEFAILLIVIIVAVLFAKSNETPVNIDYLVDVVELPIGVVLIVMFIVGGVLGYLVRLPSMWTLQAKLAKARKKLEQKADAETGRTAKGSDS